MNILYYIITTRLNEDGDYPMAMHSFRTMPHWNNDIKKYRKLVRNMRKRWQSWDLISASKPHYLLDFIS